MATTDSPPLDGLVWIAEQIEARATTELGKPKIFKKGSPLYN
ncbi:MAG: hypothetical protein ACK54E_19005 [Pseudanabaena sp.]